MTEREEKVMKSKRFDGSTVAVVGITLTTAAVALHLARSKAPPPAATPSVDAPASWGVPELVRHLEGLHLHVVAASRATGELSQGAYLCERDRPWEELVRLLPWPEHAAEWEGVVFVVSSRSLSASPAHEVKTWGANGLRA